MRSVQKKVWNQHQSPPHQQCSHKMEIPPDYLAAKFEEAQAHTPGALYTVQVHDNVRILDHLLLVLGGANIRSTESASASHAT